MSRKRTIRKVWALVNPIDYAISGACKTSKEDLDKLFMGEEAAFSAFVYGGATLAHYRTLCDLVNLCETIGKKLIGPEALPFCKLAEQELEATAKRFQKTQRFGLSGPGIAAIREVMAFHDEQRSRISRSKYEEMIRLAKAHVLNRHNTIDLGSLLEAA